MCVGYGALKVGVIVGTVYIISGLQNVKSGISFQVESQYSHGPKLGENGSLYDYTSVWNLKNDGYGMNRDCRLELQ